MTQYQHNPNPNATVRFLRKAYNPVGFKKGYNALLAFIFGGAWFGFLLARASYMNVDGDSSSSFKTNAAPGEWYWYHQGFHNVGMRLHLYTIIPCGLLSLVQFVPVIRHKFILAHRINGYFVLVLLLLVNISALMIARRAFGGSLATQTLVGTLASLTTGGAIMAYINIKRLQIDQHRAWMLRVFVYIGTIVTLRIIMIIMVIIVSAIGSYHYTVPCAQIAFDDATLMNTYAACRANPEGYTSVLAKFGGDADKANYIAVFNMSFGAAGWTALALHVIGVEIYLHLTPAEGERLRQVSYERQLERGMKHPGSAGLTSDRLGDCEPWKCKKGGTKERRASDGTATSGIITGDELELNVARPKNAVTS